MFVAVDENSKPIAVKSFEPSTPKEIALQNYAQKLMELRKGVEEEMKPFFNN